MSPSPPSGFTRLDVLLLLMVIIWGTNYSIVKSAFAEVDPQAFNAVRMALASAIFLVTMALVRRRNSGADGARAVFHTPARITGADWLGLIGLGIVGHFLYQYCFIGGLARTSVANSSLLIASTPVAIALLTAAAGHDRVEHVQWMGMALSLIGIYTVMGKGARLSGDSLAGDLLIGVAVACWALYTVGARQLMLRHSAVGVTGLSMAIGTVIYAVWARGAVVRVPWASLSPHIWGILVYSAVFALCVAYTIWYAAVRQIGNARTSAYSNLIPIVGLLTAFLWLHEPLGIRKLIGAGVILLGVALARLGGSPPGPSTPGRGSTDRRASDTGYSPGGVTIDPCP